MDSKNITQKHICIGIIVSVHGIKGFVKIKSFAETPQNITSYGKIFNHSFTKEFEIKVISANKDILIASIQGINDRNEAEKLVKTKLYINRENLPKTREDEFYINDLIGMAVVDEDSKVIGKIIQIYNFGGGDIVEIQFKGLKKTQMFSFTKEHFPEVDLKHNLIKFKQND